MYGIAMPTRSVTRSRVYSSKSGEKKNSDQGVSTEAYDTTSTLS